MMNSWILALRTIKSLAERMLKEMRTMADNTQPDKKQFTEQELETRFTYHAPQKGQPELYESLRIEAKSLATLFNLVVPDSREKALAMTRLEEAVMYANAGIARRS